MTVRLKTALWWVGCVVVNGATVVLVPWFAARFIAPVVVGIIYGLVTSMCGFHGLPYLYDESTKD